MKDLGSELSNLFSTPIQFDGLDDLTFREEYGNWKDVYQKLLNPYSTAINFYSQSFQNENKDDKFEWSKILGGW